MKCGRPRGKGNGSCSNCARIYKKTGKMPDHGKTGKNAATCPWPKNEIPREFQKEGDEEKEESEVDDDEGARPAKIIRVDIGVQTADPTEYCAVCMETRDLSRFTKFRCGHMICTACILSMARTEGQRARVFSPLGVETIDHHLLCPVCRGRAFLYSNGSYYQTPVRLA